MVRFRSGLAFFAGAAAGLLAAAALAMSWKAGEEGRFPLRPARPSRRHGLAASPQAAAAAEPTQGPLP